MGRWTSLASRVWENLVSPSPHPVEGLWEGEALPGRMFIPSVCGYAAPHPSIAHILSIQKKVRRKQMRAGQLRAHGGGVAGDGTDDRLDAPITGPPAHNIPRTQIVVLGAGIAATTVNHQTGGFEPIHR